MAISKHPDIILGVSQALDECYVANTDRILVGLSGGIDSIVLTFILLRLLRAERFGNLGIAHLNHSLRGEASDMDAEFVKRFAETFDIDYFEQKSDVRSFASSNRLGVEEAARTLRYEFFKSCVKTNAFDWVATAHNANDQLETMLMNLGRGTGIKGMIGIPSDRYLNEKANLIRPILKYNRGEILEFASQHGLQWREDESNKTDEFLRNRIRTAVIPAIEAAFDGRSFFNGVGITNANLSQVGSYLSHKVRELRQEVVLKRNDYFVRPSFCEIKYSKEFILGGLIAAEVFSKEIGKLLGQHYSLTANDREKIHRMILLEGPDKIQLSKKVTITRSFDSSTFRIDVSHPIQVINEPINIGATVETSIGNIQLAKTRSFAVSKNMNLAYIPVSYVNENGLMIRNWQSGDRIIPFGMSGSKAVSSLLGEAGIRNGPNKQNFPLIVNANSPATIIWIPGIRASELCRIHEGETAYVLRRKTNKSTG